MTQPHPHNLYEARAMGVSEQLHRRFVNEIERFYRVRLANDIGTPAIRDIRDTVQRVIMASYQAGSRLYGLPYRPNTQAISQEIEAMTGQITAWLSVQQKKSRREVQRQRPAGQRDQAYGLVSGLTPRQARGVLSNNLGAREADRRRNTRAKVIAFTEASRWINAGLDMLFLDSLDSGALGSGSMKVLKNSYAGYVCDYCRATNNQVRHITDPFDTPLGQYQNPPFHPHCRCSAVLII